MDGMSSVEPTALWLQLALLGVLAASWLAAVSWLLLKTTGAMRALVVALSAVVVIVAWIWVAPVQVSDTETPGDQATCTFGTLEYALSPSSVDGMQQECVQSSRFRFAAASAIWLLALGGTGLVAGRRRDRSHPQTTSQKSLR